MTFTASQIDILKKSKVKGYSNPDSIVKKAEEVISDYSEALETNEENIKDLIVENPFLITYNPRERLSQLLDRYGRGRRLELQRVILGTEEKKGFPKFITYSHKSALERKLKLVSLFGMDKAQLKQYVLEKNPRCITHGENRDLASFEIVDSLLHTDSNLTLDMVLGNLPKSPYVEYNGEKLRLSQLREKGIDELPDFYVVLKQRIRNANQNDRFAA